MLVEGLWETNKGYLNTPLTSCFDFGYSYYIIWIQMMIHLGWRYTSWRQMMLFRVHSFSNLTLLAGADPALASSSLENCTQFAAVCTDFSRRKGCRSCPNSGRVVSAPYCCCTLYSPQYLTESSKNAFNQTVMDWKKGNNIYIKKTMSCLSSCFSGNRFCVRKF